MCHDLFKRIELSQPPHYQRKKAPAALELLQHGEPKQLDIVSKYAITKQ